MGTTPVGVTVPVTWDARVASQTALTSTPNPSAVGQAVTLAATVTPAPGATGAPTGTVQFRSDGTALGDPVPVSAGTATLSTAGLPAGTHTVDAVYNGDTGFTSSVSTPVTQTVNPLAVTSVSPNSLVQGASNQLVTINGTGFLYPPVVTFSGTGITVDPTFVNFTSTSQFQVRVSVAADATPGARDVTVTNPGGGTATLTGGFTVTAMPPPVTVTAINPTNLNRGVINRVVTVTGTGFVTGTTVAFSGTGITTGAVTVTSPTQLTVPVTVASTATPGARDVTVKLPSGASATLTNGFNVNGPPVVTGVSPKTVPEGGTAQIAVSGSNFVSGARVTVSGTGVTVGTVTWNSSTSLTASVTVAPTANPTARSVTVTNPDTRSGTLSAALTVTAMPVLTSISPTTLPVGATNQAIAINGSGFASNFVTAGGTVSFGDGVTVLSVTRNSLTRLTARVTVSASAVPEPRNVQVNAPGGLSSSLQGAFTVAPGPTITSLNPASMRRTGTTQTLLVNGTGYATGRGSRSRAPVSR